jgi:hypothetical protein
MFLTKSGIASSAVTSALMCCELLTPSVDFASFAPSKSEEGFTVGHKTAANKQDGCEQKRSNWWLMNKKQCSNSGQNWGDCPFFNF